MSHSHLWACHSGWAWLGSTTQGAAGDAWAKPGTRRGEDPKPQREVMGLGCRKATLAVGWRVAQREGKAVLSPQEPRGN